LKTAVIIGSGNVATCFAKAFVNKGISIAAVYSRNLNHAQQLAAEVGGDAMNNFNKLPINADLYLIAVSDNVIENVSNQLKVNGLVLHTSGFTAMDALRNNKRYGVFYGLQTFNKNSTTDLNNVPFFIEASNLEDEKILWHFASSISRNVQVAKTHQRQALHVAAVFANNFSNHLFAVAKQMLEQHQLSFDLLKPIILQTAHNAVTHNPIDVQTGPVVRNDTATISAHLEVLQQYPEYRQIYELLSKSIREFHVNSTKNK
jgi:predicted short-subunit dehydrogenase-like oxidoreductase (DUF2520 family)